MSDKVLIVGLGNPGRRYVGNRHNVGFQVLDRLAAAHGLAFSRSQGQALIATGQIANRPVILAKPQTYVNESGRAVAALVRFYQVDMPNLLVVYDDLDLPFGTLRLRPEGSAGGHHGMESIIAALGRQDFPRLRIGIGRPPGRMDPVEYVLQDFDREQQEFLPELYDRAVKAIESFLSEGIVLTMSRHNTSVI
ncbi:MAG: aminoacyl-tRNA hydrolase [Chloroflexota bacterium]